VHFISLKDEVPFLFNTESSYDRILIIDAITYRSLKKVTNYG